MNSQSAGNPNAEKPLDSGLACVASLARFYRIAINPNDLGRELALGDEVATKEHLVRAAKLAGLKGRIVETRDLKRLAGIPVPAIVRQIGGAFAIFTGVTPQGEFRIVDPVTGIAKDIAAADILPAIEPTVIQIRRRLAGEGIDPRTFGFRWFLPSIWRYRKPLAHVLFASLFIQIFALVTPLFFQVIVDKVLVHKGYATLYVLIGGLAVLGLFDVGLQQLRTYALTHTTSRMDVELGQRLFHHLLRLPLGYFEMRPAGQTVARVRELESVRTFMTGQGLFSAIDIVFTIVFIAVLAAYSIPLTILVVGTIPIYFLISFVVRPLLRDRVMEKFNRGAESQQFLVESIIGIQTLKAAAVEPVLQAQWEEKLASYVRTSFDAVMLSTGGQNVIQYVSKIMMAAILLFGAKAVMDGTMTVGGLIAFNLIAGQVVQPILRLSQFWQDFQQFQISVDRLGDILNAAVEPRPQTSAALPAPRGAIEFKNVGFRYRPNAPAILKSISLSVQPGEVIGIVGPSGSGKSTLTKLVQRLYLPEEGQVLVDGLDIAHVDPSWLRRHIGVVLQDSMLFNRSIHDNIALANPSLPRAAVMEVARLAGADEFIEKMPNGYESMIEERGANLSGGQRQRLAIARALATNPPILIFDEATSALDYESERVIQQNMRRIAQGRTVIIIAHRLAAVRGCNRIISMADGKIVEMGPHEDLLRKPGGLYARLWAMQGLGEAA